MEPRPTGGLVHRVREFETQIDGSVTVHGSSMSDPRKAPASAPLAALDAGPTVAVPSCRTATVTVVSQEPPDGLQDPERLLRQLHPASGVELVVVSWGDVAIWVPAEPLRGAAATAVGSAFVLAPVDCIVPSLPEARGWLADTGRVPGGQRGQGRRERGHTWPAVPAVESWREDASDVWVLGGLLEEASDLGGAERSSLLVAPFPWITTLTPGGAPVLVATAGGGLVSRTNDRVLTPREGRDGEGSSVAVALHRSSGDIPALELPLWPGQTSSHPTDGSCGEVMEYEDGDDPDYVSRCRLRVTPFGRLTFPSHRIVASDPCVAGCSPALGLELPDEGPFVVLRADLLTVMDNGRELVGETRGILVVLDEVAAPVRWEPARDAEGRPIHCSIDTGQLLLGDAEGSNAVQRQRHEGTVDYGSQARLRLLRSNPLRPADIAVLEDLGGDGSAWVVVGVAEDGHPVAVMVSNFDPLG